MPADDNMDDQPTVRHMSWEYFKDLYERERELREAEVDALKAEIRHERELREQRMEMTAAELALQAKEYERRLDDLNHAHTQARETQADYMRADTGESNKRASEAEARGLRDVLESYRKEQETAQRVARDAFEAYKTEQRLLHGEIDVTFAEERGGRQRTTSLMAWGLFIVAILSIAMKFIR